MEALQSFLLSVAFSRRYQASAREALDINLESVCVEEQKLHIYVNDNLKRDKEQQADGEQYTVTLGTQELPVTDIRKFKDSKEAASYIFWRMSLDL